MAEITERREVRVRGEDGTFVFAAEPEAGRLVIREERDGDEAEELCALTIADREELSGFLAGLRRVLGVEESPQRDQPLDQRDRGGGAERQQQASRTSLPAGGTGPSGTASSEGGSPASRSEGEDQRERDEEERRQAAERARARGQGNAFAAWTRDEEQRLLAAVEEGRDLDAVAREHGRSRRALELRLERLRQGDR